MLGAAFNLKNGKGIDRKATYRAVAKIGEDKSYDGTRIVALLGVTDSTVKGMLSEMRARKRADMVGINLNGDVTASSLKLLGQSSDKLDDAPCREVASLAQDTGMSVSELRDVITQLKEAGSEEAKLQIIAEQRSARRLQIAERQASGKAKTPIAAQLRQRLGFINKYEIQPWDLAEYNPDLVDRHRESIQRAIAVLQRLLEAPGHSS